jgi:hypothetical protein
MLGLRIPVAKFEQFECWSNAGDFKIPLFSYCYKYNRLLFSIVCTLLNMLEPPAECGRLGNYGIHYMNTKKLTIKIFNNMTERSYRRLEIKRTLSSRISKVIQGVSKKKGYSKLLFVIR